MASVQQRPNGRWAVRWRDQDGLQRWRTFTNKGEAKSFAKVVEFQVSTAPTPTCLRLTLDEFASAWVSRQIWRQSTRDAYTSHYRRHIRPQLGDQLLADLKPSELQHWVKELSDQLSAGTVQVIASHMRSMLADAVREGLLPTNPGAGLRLPRLDRRIIEPPTLHQLQSLAEGLPCRYRALVSIGASTGMRQGECFGLTLDRVDFSRKQIRIDRQLVTDGHGTPSFGPPKTRASVRTVPVTDRTLTEIQDQVDRYPTSRGFVFSSAADGPISRTRFSDLWRPAAAAVGLPPRTGMHCLRHFYASALIRAGCSVKVVQARLGHATAAETLDTYAHLWHDDEDRTRAAIEAVISW